MRDDKKPTDNVQRHTISLPAELSDWVEAERGDVPFSKFVHRALETYRLHIGGKSKAPSGNARNARAGSGGALTQFRS